MKEKRMNVVHSKERVFCLTSWSSQSRVQSARESFSDKGALPTTFFTTSLVTTTTTLLVRTPPITPLRVEEVRDVPGRPT